MKQWVTLLLFPLFISCAHTDMITQFSDPPRSVTGDLVDVVSFQWSKLANKEITDNGGWSEIIEMRWARHGEIYYNYFCVFCDIHGHVFVYDPNHGSKPVTVDPKNPLAIVEEYGYKNILEAKFL